MYILYIVHLLYLVYLVHLECLEYAVYVVHSLRVCACACTFDVVCFRVLRYAQRKLPCKMFATIIWTGGA